MDRAGAAVVQAPKMEIDFRQIVERSRRQWWWSLSGLLPPQVDESVGTQTCIHQNIVQHSKFEKKDLPTTELGTTCQTGIRYIMPFFRNIVHHRKQEYCTSMKTGILYNTEKRNFVQHRKQEYCTSLIR